MNGPHDLGGQMGFGAVRPDPDEPVFHADWEGRALGLSLGAACLGYWTLDESRYAYELIPPAAYLGATYYEIWIRGLDWLLEYHGVVAKEELFGNPDVVPISAASDNILRPHQVDEMLASGAGEMPFDRPPCFGIGDKVRTRNINPTDHTRLPRYARGRSGQIAAVQGFYAFADDNAHGRGKNPQWVYTVVFTGAELWGDDADPALQISIDAWESYLIAAE